MNSTWTLKTSIRIVYFKFNVVKGINLVHFYDPYLKIHLYDKKIDKLHNYLELL